MGADGPPPTAPRRQGSSGVTIELEDSGGRKRRQAAVRGQGAAVRLGQDHSARHPPTWLAASSGAEASRLRGLSAAISSQALLKLVVAHPSTAIIPLCLMTLILGLALWGVDRAAASDERAARVSSSRLPVLVLVTIVVDQRSASYVVRSASYAA
jgi:hypothetical protein